MVPLLKVLPLGVLFTLLVLFAVAKHLRAIDHADPMHRASWVFLGTVAAGVFVAVNHYWLLVKFQDTVAHVIVLFVALPLLLRHREHAEKIVWIILLATFVTAIWALTHRGKGQGAWLGDENDVTLMLNVGLCFAYFARRDFSSRRKRLLCDAVMVAAVVAVVFSFSRGGFVGLAVAITAIAVLSGKLLKSAMVIAALVTIAVPLLATLEPPEGRGKSRTYLEELRSIGDQSDSTRLARMYVWRGGWVMFKNNPLIGIGAGNFPWRLGSYESHPELTARNTFGRSFAGRAAHSTWFQLLPETGLLGTSAFAVLLVCALRRSYRWVTSSDSSHFRALGGGVCAGLLAFSAAGTFVSALWYPLVWLLFGIAVALRQSPKQHLDPGGLGGRAGRVGQHASPGASARVNGARRKPQ
jgi:O-antigen ligase